MKSKILLFALLSVTSLTVRAKESANYSTFKKRDYKVNPKIDPCNDFYAYVCSETINNFTLPKTRARHDFSFSDIKEYLLSQKKIYFNKLSKGQASSKREKQLQNYFLGCMNKDANIKGERSYVESILKNLSTLTTKKQFINYIYQEMTSGRSSYTGVWGDLPNFNDSRFMDLYFDINVVTLPEVSYYQKNQVVKALIDVMGVFFKEIGIKDYKKRAKQVIEFELEMARVYPSQKEINKKVFSPTELTKKEAKSLNNLKHLDFIKSLDANPHTRNLYGIKAFEKLNHLMETKDLQTLKSIYLFSTLRPLMYDAYPKYRNKMTQFKSKYFGSPAQLPPREEMCTKEIETKFGMEVDSILFPKLFPNFPKKKITKMVKRIKKGVIKTVQRNAWLSPKAKKAAIKKLNHANIRLVAPVSDQEWGFNLIGNYSPTKPILNKIHYQELTYQKTLKNFKKKFTQPVWEFGPLTANAALLPFYNAIIFPAAMFLPPFYDVNLPEELNMAAIGTVIGHELGHMIDDKGYTFDYKGRIKPWVTNADKARFEQHAKPLISQFDKIGHSGKFTLGENIGDLVGLTIAYEQAFTKNHNKELKKKFFAQYAKMWCEVQRDEIAKLRLKVDPHSLGFARTNEQVKHQKGFYEAYSCKKGDKLVLSDKDRVRIW